MPARCCVCARAPTCELSSVETVSSIPPSSRIDGRACGRLHVADGYTHNYTYRRPGYTWDVHIADEARMIGSASIFALAPLALRRPLLASWGARFPRGARSGRPRVAGSDLELDPVTAPSRSIATGRIRTHHAGRARGPRHEAARTGARAKGAIRRRADNEVEEGVSRKTHPQTTKQYMQSKNT